MEPREITQRIEAQPVLPAGGSDRFSGYAVIGLPFQSGHVLALRRFPASSIGPGYTSVWHRDPKLAWTMYSTVRPEMGCARYFGGEIAQNVVTPILVEWTGAREFCVRVGSALRWEVRLGLSTSARLLTAVAGLVPDAMWRRKGVLHVMGHAARFLLGSGKMNLTGLTPNGQEFMANPKQVWLIDSSQAQLNGHNFGPMGPLEQQARLNEFLIPQRGLFAIADAFLERRDHESE